MTPLEAVKSLWISTLLFARVYGGGLIAGYEGGINISSK
jgi:hypothetical protein